MKRSFECKLSDSEKAITVFFMGDVELIEKFIELAAHMMELDSDVIVRCNSSIIGVSKPGEKYRFYVSNRDNNFSIKYKNESQLRSFQETPIKDLYALNVTCNKFFQDNPQEIAVKSIEKNESVVESTDKSHKNKKLDKSEVKAQWRPVLIHAEKAIDAGKQNADVDLLDVVYSKVVEIFWGVSFQIFDERDCKIVVSRYLDEEKTTLQNLGKKYNLSKREISQLADSGWHKICYGIQNSGDEVYSFFRNQLCQLLLEIDVTSFIQCIAYIFNKNLSLGEFIIKVTTPTYRPQAYETEIAKYQVGGTKRVSVEGRIPQEIADAVHNLDIVKHIGTHQALKQKGEVYQGVCLYCNSKSLTVYPKTNSFYCFSCKKGGDIITYERAKEKMDYRIAVLSLAETYGIIMEEKMPSRDIVMKTAAHFYHQQLRSNLKNKKAIDVLHSWGLVGKTIVNLGLGFNDDTIVGTFNYMTREKQIPYNALVRYNLAGRTDKGSYYDRMRNSIIIPTVSISGKVESFDYYILDKGEFKHCLSSDDFVRREHLYSLNIAVDSKKQSVVVVSNYESYFALLAAGITNAVSIYMTQISQKQMEMLKQYFKVIIFIADGYSNISDCRKFCQKNDMYCDNISIGQDSALDYIKNNADEIVEKIDYYESVFK